MFKYCTGEEVELGDCVFTGNHKFGFVKFILYPGTPEAEGFLCPNGGIVVEEDWDGVASHMAYALESVAEWQDLQFVGRAAS